MNKNPSHIDILYNTKVSDIYGRNQEFSFADRVSVSRLQELRTNIDASVPYMTGLLAIHMDEMISAQPWVCSARSDECRNPAVYLVSTPMSYLDRDPPHVVGCMTTPICHDPKCSVVAQHEHKKIMKDISKKYEGDGKTSPGSSLYDIKVRQCGHCHRSAKGESDLLRCGRCQIAYYCNKECQTAHWTLHKRFCIKVKLSK